MISLGRAGSVVLALYFSVSSSLGFLCDGLAAVPCHRMAPIAADE